jgi:hypothetical protein
VSYVIHVPQIFRKITGKRSHETLEIILEIGEDTHNPIKFGMVPKLELK